MTFHNNVGKNAGGAAYIQGSVTFILSGKCTITTNSNSAGRGGGLCLVEYSVITFKENATVEFNNNIATLYSGGIHSEEYCNIGFEGNSLVTFNNNKAPICGVIGLINSSIAIFKEISIVLFANNTVNYSGAAFFVQNTNITLKETVVQRRSYH